MLRAKKRAIWRSALGSALGLFATISAPAAAAPCLSGRPTDKAGAAGISYGSAQVAFFDSASGAARVHYALSGTHAPPSAATLGEDAPDAVVVAARAADDALAKFHELGYEPPLGDADSPCASNGDSAAIDIYLIHFSAADGQAPVDHCEGDAPRRCAGFVLVENDFRSAGYANVAEGMRTVVPHELFHLVQDAYDADVERWWAEGSAQWAAQQTYADLHDLERFLPGYFENPWRPLNVPPNGIITDFLYATAIWPVYLHQRFGPDVVRKIYEGFASDRDGVLPTTDRVLGDEGSSLAAEFLRFAAYNAGTDTRAPETGGYPDAARYPRVPLTTLSASSGKLVSGVGSGLGAYYYSVEAATATELLLSGDSRVAGMLVPLLDGKADLEHAEPLPAKLQGAGIVVVAGQDLSRTDAPFTLTGKDPSSSGSKDDAAKSSGCAFGEQPQNTDHGLVFVLSLLGLWRARRPRKGA